MSPLKAIHSEIFVTYLAIVGGLLAVAGAAILVARYGFRRNVHAVWRTYLGWLIMIPIIGGTIFLGRWAVVAGGTAVSIFAFREFARATLLIRDRWLTIAGYALLGLAGLFTLLNCFALFIAFPVIAVMVLFLIPIVRDRAAGQLQTVAYAIVGVVCIGWLFAFLPWLANHRSNPYGCLIFLIVATELNDIAGFTFGKLLGRRPLRPRISPGKTWEGATGALGVSLLLPWAFYFSLPGFAWWQRIVAGLIVGIGAPLGDLVMSLLKRDLGLKDMGTLIPGHGGLLDRIDSLLWVAPLFVYLSRAVVGL